MVWKSVQGDQEWTATFPSDFVSCWYANLQTSKSFTTVLTPLTQNEYTVTDSFHFAEEIDKQDPNLYMASLEVDSLFTNIQLGENIDICINSLYKDDENTPKIPKEVFRDFLNVATEESFFAFNKKFYKQINDVAMGSPLGPAPANTFMSSFENKWLKACPQSLKPVFYKRYVDIFVFFSGDNTEKIWAHRFFAK